MNIDINEMAKPPRTRHQAEKRVSILPANRSEASRFINEFWTKFLSDNRGSSSFCSVCKEPSAPFDQYIDVQTSDPSYKTPWKLWLDWHASVTFRVAPKIAFTFFISSLDEPGAYRIDYILLGQKRAVVQQIRDRVTKYVKYVQRSIKAALSEEERADFERIKTSIRKIPHTHKEGIRDDDRLIGRLILDEIPLSHLPSRANEIKNITIHVGDIILDTIGNAEQLIT